MTEARGGSLPQGKPKRDDVWKYQNSQPGDSKTHHRDCRDQRSKFRPFADTGEKNNRGESHHPYNGREAYRVSFPGGSHFRLRDGSRQADEDEEYKEGR